MLRYVCPKCRRRIKLDNPGQAVRVRCPNCQTIVWAKVKDKHADPTEPAPTDEGPVRSKEAIPLQYASAGADRPAAAAAPPQPFPSVRRGGPPPADADAPARSAAKFPGDWKRWMFASIALLATAASVLIIVVIVRMLAGPPPAAQQPPTVAAPQPPTGPERPAPIEPEPPTVMRLAANDGLREHLRSQGEQIESGLLIHAQPASHHQGPLEATELFDLASPAVARVLVKDQDARTIAGGTGFFISRDGLLVTNHHVITGGRSAAVQLADRRTLLVEGVAAVDREADLVLLKVRGSDLAYLAVHTDALPKVGAKVFAIGNPKGGAKNTFSDGIVSGVQQLADRRTVIQTNAAIGAGSSGGPLLGSDGKVVGVIAAFHRSGQNLNFAIAAPHIRRLLRNRGAVRSLAGQTASEPPPRDTEQLASAWEAMDRKDYPAAERVLTALRGKQKENPFVWFASGALAARKGDQRAAAGHYRQAARLKDDFPEAHFLLGLACSNLEQYEQALEAFRRVTALWPKSAQAHCQTAVAFGCLGRHAEAIAAARRALAIRPDYAEAHFCLGFDLLALKRYDEAAASLSEAVRINAALAEAHLFLGKAQAARRHGWTAIQSFRNAIAARPRFADAYLELGHALMRVRRFKEALAAYEDAARLAADEPSAQLARKGIALARSKLGSASP